MTLKGGKVNTIKALKSSLKKGSGANFLQRVPEEGIAVRFLTEPTEWVKYFEHYDEVLKFYPCADDCPGCAEGNRASVRYLVNALDVAEGKVVPLVLPKTVAQQVLKKYERYNTLLDRDYEITRDGAGLDTTYDVNPEPPKSMKLSRYDLLDLMALLEAQLPSEDEDEDDEDDDEDEATPVRPTKKLPTKKLPTKKKPPVKKLPAKKVPPRKALKRRH